MIDEHRSVNGRNAVLLLLCVNLLSTLAGCSHKAIRAPATAAPLANNSYMDLEAGWGLRVVLPLLKSGGFRITASPQQTSGNTVTIPADDLIGYEVAYFAIKAAGSRGVRLQFASAETTRDGKTVPEQRQPALPFELPLRTEHIRLIYFVRVSQADHNMAIVASKRIESLNAFTQQLKANPAACESDKEIFCSWVPAGIAVRPERP